MPIPLFAIIAAAIAAVALSYLLRPKVKGPKPPSLEDYENPTAEAGRPWPVIFGTVTVKGLNNLWYGDKRIRISDDDTVYRYHMSQHFGVCLGADRMTRIIIKEKLAWEGSISAIGTITINKQNLFGGKEKEGGAAGIVHYLPGAADQLLPDLLAQKMGRADGTDCPAYRGMLTLFFRGEPGALLTGSSLGFYWGAGSPYLPGVWVTVQRTPVGPPSAPTEYALTFWQSYVFAEGEPEPNSADDGRVKGQLSWYDADENLLSFEESVFERFESWTETTVTATRPEDAAALRVRLHMSGSEFDVPGSAWGAVDAVALTADGVAVSLTNPGAEDGDTTGWTVEPGDIFSTIEASNVDLVAHEGTWFFRTTTGMISPANVLMQEVALSDDGGGGTFGCTVDVDANPACIIYECLTNADWGMGSPAAAIDTDSFVAARATLTEEEFGLSLIWTQQSEIQSFIQEVLDHIQAVLFVDPATGLLTLKLIRGDYDEAELDTISPDNAELSNFGRKLWGDIVNEIVVTWTNPENEQDETVTMQDLASIAAQGGQVISDGRNYYGIRNKALAQRVAQRDLRASGAPLATCEAQVDRTLWQTRPASVHKVTWPEHGLSELVMRVVDVDYGRPGDPIIKLSLIEDVFGLDVGDYVEPPGTIFEDPAEEPEAATIERALTLPHYFAMNSPASEYAASPDYPEVVAGILATTTQDDAWQFELWEEVEQPDASLEWEKIGALSVIGHGTLDGALVAEASSTGVSFGSLIGDNGPEVSGFVLIGDEAEEDSEIALITDDASDYTLQRGCLDTIPRAWPMGTPVWFIDAETMFEDSIVRASGDTTGYKLLTATSMGLLDLDDATEINETLTDRPWLPNRPANVQVDGVSFNSLGTPVDMITRPDPWVTISWANRNRLLEETAVLAWGDATQALESGQTTTITVYAEDGSTVLDTHTGETGTDFDVPDASFGTESIVLLVASSERTDGDGTFASLQAHGIWVQVALAGDPITEEGDGIILEEGDELILEG